MNNPTKQRAKRACAMAAGNLQVEETLKRTERLPPTLNTPSAQLLLESWGDELLSMIRIRNVKITQRANGCKRLDSQNMWRGSYPTPRANR